MNGIIINPHTESVLAVVLDQEDVLSHLRQLIGCRKVQVIIPNQGMTMYADEEALFMQQPGFTFTTWVPGTDKKHSQVIAMIGIAIVLGPPDGEGNDTAALCTPATVQALVQWDP